MKILGVDSSGLTCSVAIYVDGVVVAESSVNNSKTHSQTLLPMIEKIISDAGLQAEDIDFIAAAEGPGSFTGLRIGAATVKGLSLALDKPVVPVSTLAGLACNVAGMDGIICPIMDARRNQVYTAVYSFEGDIPVNHVEPAAMAIDEIIAVIKQQFIENSNVKKVTFLGDGVPVHEEYIKEQLGDAAYIAQPHLRLQNAASIAVYAEILYKEGKVKTGDEFEPVYLRLSQAERERLNKQ